MAVEYSLSVQEQYINVIAAGHITKLDEITNYAAEVIKHCHRVDCFLVLVDERQLVHSLRIIDALRYIGFLVKNTPSRGRAAVLYHEHDAEQIRFVQNLALNRNRALRFFKDEEKAKKWLLEKSEDFLCHSNMPKS